jgi:hypothetical protein
MQLVMVETTNWSPEVCACKENDETSFKDTINDEKHTEEVFASSRRSEPCKER